MTRVLSDKESWAGGMGPLLEHVRDLREQPEACQKGMRGSAET